jgi:hypothetical protein
MITIKKWGKMVSEKLGWVLDQRFTTKLSIAVFLIDDFTEKRKVKGQIEISIPDEKLKALKNPSGYYNFLDIPDGTYTIEVKPELYLKEKIENFALPRSTNYNLAASGAPAGSTSAKLTSINGLRDGDVLEFDNSSDPPELRIIYIDSNPTIKKIHWDKDPEGGLLYDYSSGDTASIPFPFNFVLPVTLKPNHLYSFPSGITLIRGSLFDANGDPIADAKIEVAAKKIKTRTSRIGDFVLYFPASQDDESIQIKATPSGQPSNTVSCEVKKGKTVTISINYT